MSDNLTDKQRAFVAEYLKDFNATQAAIRAGYSEKTARQQGSENLSKPYIRERIDDHLQERMMSAEEAIARLSEQARASMEPFLSMEGGDVSIDLSTDKAQQALHLLKKAKIKDDQTEIRLHDAQKALVEILKLHDEYTQQVDITTDGEPLTADPFESMTTEEKKQALRERLHDLEALDGAPDDPKGLPD